MLQAFKWPLHHPKIILKIYLLLSIGGALFCAIGATFKAHDKFYNHKVAVIESVLHMKYLQGYNDFYVLLAFTGATAITCVLGIAGTVLGNMLFLQIFTWMMFLLSMGVFTFTTVMYGDETGLTLLMAYWSFHAQFISLCIIKNKPKLYEIGTVLQRTLECCGLNRPSNWGWKSFTDKWGNVNYPAGCCSKIYSNSCRTPIWKGSCTMAIRQLFDGLLTGVRQANLAYCFFLFHAALFGAVLSLSLYRPWIPPPSISPRRSDRIIVSPDDDRARHEAAKEAHIAEKKEREERKAREHAALKQQALDHAREKAERKAREKEEKMARRMAAREERRSRRRSRRKSRRRSTKILMR